MKTTVNAPLYSKLLQEMRFTKKPRPELQDEINHEYAKRFPYNMTFVALADFEDKQPIWKGGVTPNRIELIILRLWNLN